MNKVAKFCFGWALLGFGGGASGYFAHAFLQHAPAHFGGEVRLAILLSLLILVGGATLSWSAIHK